MTEQDLLNEILNLCDQHSILVHHCNDSRKCAGSGLPDLILVGMRNILFAELKTEFGELSSAQVDWKYRLIAAGAHHVIWRPSDLPHIRTVLSEL